MRYLMVIEDNQGDVDLLLEVNEILGREESVIAIDNGDGVLEAIKVYKPYLILMDLNLPGKGGLEIIAEIRKAKVTTPVLVMSTSQAWPDVKGAYNAGANAYIIKPFGIPNLVNTMATIYRFWDLTIYV